MGKGQKKKMDLKMGWKTREIEMWRHDEEKRDRKMEKCLEKKTDLIPHSGFLYLFLAHFSAEA